MITKDFATHFAAEWITAWNSHDLQQILEHYSEDFEMTSPYIALIAGEATGTLKGKEKIGDYWAKALELTPDLYFELLNTLVGVNSLTLYYRGVRGLAAEVFHFDSKRKVTKAYAHYL